jgi:decaprenyl-phosphate phosphoribosyltransferase
VFAAPGAAGVLTEAKPLVQTLIAFVCFCLAASGTYFLNDAADVEAGGSELHAATAV